VTCPEEERERVELLGKERQRKGISNMGEMEQLEGDSFQDSISLTWLPLLCCLLLSSRSISPISGFLLRSLGKGVNKQERRKGELV
jgi:hypothetical protein